MEFTPAHLIRIVEKMKNRTLLQFWRPRKHDFLRGGLSIFGDMRDDGGSFAQRRYPCDAQQQDMVRVGRDVRRAMGMVRREVLSTNANGTGPRREPSAGAGISWPSEAAPRRMPNDPRKSAAGPEVLTEAIPSPAMLAEYEKILPGSAERIIRMVEAERNHRHDWEVARISGDASEIMRSQWIGLAIVIGSIFAATFLAVSDKVALAGIVGAVGILWFIAGIPSMQGKQKTSKA